MLRKPVPTITELIWNSLGHPANTQLREKYHPLIVEGNLIVVKPDKTMFIPVRDQLGLYQLSAYCPRLPDGPDYMHIHHEVDPRYRFGLHFPWLGANILSDLEHLKYLFTTSFYEGVYHLDKECLKLFSDLMVRLCLQQTTPRPRDEFVKEIQETLDEIFKRNPNYDRGRMSKSKDFEEALTAK